jgi:UTP--glucose-1-phosphate uridylyltransferase
MPPVRKAVILATGLATRMLPATKAVPQELLPIVDRPLIQYAVEEAVNAGVTDVIFVMSPGREAIQGHFGVGGPLARYLDEAGDERLLRLVEGPAALARFHYVYQERRLGTAHAVACARLLLEGEPFALLLPNDLIVSFEPCLAQLVRAWEVVGGSVIAVHDVPPADTSQYAIVDVIGSANPAPVRAIIQKPVPTIAPSNLGVVGRYVLSETIFSHIDRIVPGAGGMSRITDALISQIAAGEPVSAFRFTGRRFDTGVPLGYLAGSIAVALEREDLRGPLINQLRTIIDAGVR